MRRVAPHHAEGDDGRMELDLPLNVLRKTGWGRIAHVAQ
jgi:hypothetical protein